MADNDPLGILRSVLRKSRQGLVFVVGSGVSIAASGDHPCASWTGLLADGLKTLKELTRTPGTFWETRVKKLIKSRRSANLLVAASRIEECFGGTRDGSFHSWIMNAVGALPLRDARVPNALLDVGAPILTTNYDNLLEDAARQKGLGFNAITWAHASESIRRALNGDRAIFHIHGHLSRPDTIVLGARSYKKLRHDAEKRLNCIAMLKTLAFVGCGTDGLDDPSLGRLLDTFAAQYQGQLKHYVLVCGSQVGRYRRFRRDPLEVLEYGPDYSDLSDAIETLKEESPGRRPLRRPVRRRPSADARAEAQNQLRRHMAEFKAGNLSEALKTIEEARRADPSEPGLLRDWVKTAIRCNELPNTIQNGIASFRREFGDSPLVRLAEGELLRHEGNYEEAIRVLDADAADPNTPLRSIVLFETGSARLSLYCNDTDLHRSELTAAVELLKRSKAEGGPDRYWVDVNLALAKRLERHAVTKLEQSAQRSLDTEIRTHPQKWNPRLYRLLLAIIRNDPQSVRHAMSDDGRQVRIRHDRHSYRQLDMWVPRIAVLYRENPRMADKYLSCLLPWMKLWIV